jgi:hypothetical protein
MLAHRRVYNEEHAIFRDAVRRFIADQITPNFARWEERGRAHCFSLHSCEPLSAPEAPRRHRQVYCGIKLTKTTA